MAGVRRSDQLLRSLYIAIYKANPVNSGEALTDNAEGNPEPSPIWGRCNDYSVKEVHSSEWKRRASNLDDEIVSSVWKHTAASSGLGLALLNEDNVYRSHEARNV
jgi:hypothetical protein